MTQGGFVEFIAKEGPLGHELGHVGVEAGVVVSFEQVNHFMHDDVFEAVGRFFDEFEVEPDALLFDVAGAPFRFHVFDSPVGDFDADDGFPFLDEGWDDGFELLAIPLEQDALSLRSVASCAHKEVDPFFRSIWD